VLGVHQVDHPRGCHRPRIPDRVVDARVQVLVVGCASQRIDDATVAATTRRWRRMQGSPRV
jgi:hypothetical protein